MKNITIIAIIIAIIGSLVLSWNFLAYRDVDDIKNNAAEHLRNEGYNIVTYIGFNGCPFTGGFVYYNVVRSDRSTELLYMVGIINWRGEYQMNQFKCLDAVYMEE